MRPLNPKHTLTAEQKAAARKTKQEAAVRSAKMEVAATYAARDLSAANVGVVRSSLFDADEWKKEHQAREARMESTFGRLYKPQASSYWVQKPKPPVRKPAPVQLPSYTNSVPQALSLQHPASREIASDDEDDEPDAASPPPHPAADFDPLAEPRRFYADFKGRVAALRGDVKAPNDRNEGISSQPRAADAVVAAATAPSPPPAVEAPAAAPPKDHTHASWALSALSAPLLDEDFDVEPSLVYTDSAHYLADHGVQIPMWDELDGELAALDAAHTESMKALALYNDPRRPAATDASDAPVNPGRVETR